MKGLTERQKAVLQFIKDRTEMENCPPTVREMADHFHVSLKAIQDHVAALRTKGYLSPANGRSRSLKILISDDLEKKVVPELNDIPMLGAVAAGKPIFCEENFDGTISLPDPFIAKEKKYFALRVRGTSMIDAGILDGDIAIIEQKSVANDGEIVVALIDDTATLKRFYKEELRIRLQPENKAFQPIYTQDAKILGVLSTIIRAY